ncbi:beta-glucuronidase isoform X1 [Onthophagus taurus]|uniref:beta-glucuronidase isoform X1 n=2 Tax=Onthophagus taurus TaxID=166361 RepID=UPI0039BEB58D
MFFLILLSYSISLVSTQQEGILFPQTSETRETISLDGIWNFAVAPISDPLIGFRQLWYRKDLQKSDDIESILMPVPSSYNDITQDPNIRDHVGIVWYDRTFFVPKSWQNQRVWLRFSSVSYAAQVWINGQLSMNHEVGHLPFQSEVNDLLNFGEENRVTVACDNTLLSDTIPQGSVIELDTDEGTVYSQSYSFDFFNYAGIHRPVTLYTTPKDYIDDIMINTKIVGKTGYVSYNISYFPKTTSASCNVMLISQDEKVVAYSTDDIGTLTVENATFWWPYLMDENPGYLYTLKVFLSASDGSLLDVYRLKIGIRELSWSNTTWLINGKKLYLHGFGRHEDSDIRGKGLDFPTIIKDHNLIKWIGANAYRTSHYPYAEEIMDLADQLGIMIIDECPSVNTEIFSVALLEKHLKSLTELIKRDKNRPSVVAWSIANEPRTQLINAGPYFRDVATHVKSLDQSRPITIAIAQGVSVDQSAEHLDIIGFNRYNAWYQNGGRLDTITNNVIEEATGWFEKHNKPVMMLEYGADTLEGLHIHPNFIWSEEYQVELMSQHFKAFDVLREKGFFVGEFIWNFADFKTAQTYTRVGGNKKGIFTRNRQPKAGAHHLRKRYHKLAEELYNATLPSDLFHYLVSNNNNDIKDEL